MQKINLSQKQAEIVNLGEGAFLIEAQKYSPEKSIIFFMNIRN